MNPPWKTLPSIAQIRSYNTHGIDIFQTIAKTKEIELGNPTKYPVKEEVGDGGGGGGIAAGVKAAEIGPGND